MAEIYAPYVRDTVVSFEQEPPTADEMAHRLAAYVAWWVAEDASGEVVGYAYASPHRERAAYRWCVEVSVYVDARWQRRGLGRGLYAALFDDLRERRFVHAYAGIALPNPSSVALHESLGFRPIGVYEKTGFKLGAWHDVGWWHLLLRRPPISPEEPCRGMTE